MSINQSMVAIIGAGPYGLAIAAHLRAQGIATSVFGEPMAFWQHHMPHGMLLRSSKRSSSIGSPNGGSSLDDYATQNSTRLPDPLPLDRFINYGKWFQRIAVPECDWRRVSNLGPAPGGFRLVLEDADEVSAKYVIVAAGISRFAHMPEQFAGLPSDKVSHSSEHTDLQKFSGMRVLVIGSGQSAFESAALLLESGAEVEIVVRSSRVIWLSNKSAVHHLPSWLGSLLDPGTDVGPLGLNQLVARQRLFALLPHQFRDPIAYRCIRPAVAPWLATRVAQAQITTSTEIANASLSGKNVKLELSNGTSRLVDHVLFATGYRVDISRYSFIDRALFRSIAQFRGYPLVSHRFESSVAGLFFAGAPAAFSLGPVCRFVAGTQYCARAISRAIASAVSSRGNSACRPANGVSDD
jgi:thioredoxin reductase